MTECPAHRPFDPLSAEYLADPFPILAELRAGSPVFHDPELDMWVVTRFADVERVLKDGKLFSGANTQQPIFPLSDEARAIMAAGFHATPTLSNGPEPRHGRVRAHCLKAFSARRLQVLAPRVRARTTELVERMLEEDTFDVVGALTHPLPASVVFALIGFPPEDSGMLKDLAEERMLFTWGRPDAAAQKRVAEFMVRYWRYCDDFVRRQLAEPGDNFTGDLLRIHLADPAALTVDEVVNVIHAVSFAGHETTTDVATSALLRLLSHREQWDAICADPGLIPGAVEEALRFDPSLFTWRRTATADTDIGGVPVPRGARLLLVIGSANHDPDRFPDPESFDVTRAGSHRHLTFGRGGHYCFGAPLARMELAAILELLTARAPGLRLVPGQRIAAHENICFRGPRRLLLEHDRTATA